MYSFKLEAINDNVVQRYKSEKKTWPDWKEKPPSPWVAKITGISKKYGYEREFMECKKDYSDANRAGSRGVYFYWVLDDGIYEVQELRPRKKPLRYFIETTGRGKTGIETIEESRVKACLLENAILELVCSTQRDKELLGHLTHSLASQCLILAERIQQSCCTL